MSSARPFKTVQSNHPRKSLFKLDYEKIMDCSFGKLYPIVHDEMVPGDIFNLGVEMVIRFSPLVTSLMHSVSAYVHYFFVPHRLTWPGTSPTTGWEAFITGGINGNDAQSLPSWDDDTFNVYNAKGDLWDYFGFPTADTPIYPTGCLPNDFQRRAYNLIWNEFYRDETLQTKIPLEPTLGVGYKLLYRNWAKDYFTSCLPNQQRGTAPALPISGYATGTLIFHSEAVEITGDRTNPSTDITMHTNGTSSVTDGTVVPRVNLASAATFNASDMRLIFQIQKFMERNARAGVRYKEFIQSHFGEHNGDDRLQRPQYIGGVKVPIIISEVLQTSQTTTGTNASPQGNIAGHGISVSSQYVGKYHATEFGTIMGILSIMPTPLYSSQGVNRQWLRQSRYDFYFPEFANLSEQAVLKGEIFCSYGANEEKNIETFGYQGRYDEMRYKPSMTVGLMRPYVSGSLAQWHLGRYFTAHPTLNEEFIQCIPDGRIFAVPEGTQMIVHVGNRIKAVRPLPIAAEPGLVDHNGG